MYEGCKSSFNDNKHGILTTDLDFHNIKYRRQKIFVINLTKNISSYHNSHCCSCVSLLLSVNAIMRVKLYFKTNLKFRSQRGSRCRRCFSLSFLQSLCDLSVESLHPGWESVIVVTRIGGGKIVLR